MVTLDGEVTKTSWKRQYENYGLSDRKEPAPHGAEGTWCQAGRTASQRASSRSKLSVVQMGMVLRSSHLTLYMLQRGMEFAAERDAVTAGVEGRHWRVQEGEKENPNYIL